MLSKEFPGGILVLSGAISATGLRSMPARYIFLDEVDAYPASADEEGDPVTLAEARTTTFSHRRKVFMVSTPTIRGISRIEREYEASDQRRYFVPCPHCGAMQWLQFERLRWDKGRPDTAAYHSEGCERPIAEHHKTRMLELGEWRATAISADPHSIGFHISALYSPLGWKSCPQIARDWLAAQGSEEMLRAARNHKDNGPANIAILRRRALDLARRDTSRGSLSIKLKRAGWSDAFPLSLLNQSAKVQAKHDCPAARRPCRR